MVIFYVQAVSSVSLTVRSVSAPCRVRMSHFRSAPGAGGQVLPVTAAPLGVLCSGLGPPLLSCALLCTPRALVFQGRCP